MNLTLVNTERMRRQGLLSPVTEDHYDAMFRAMSPVHTLYWTEPGAPPLLQRRAAFDDLSYNNRRRASREILKGRYQNGSVGYVDRRDLVLYAGAYVKPLEAFRFEEITLLELLRQGPLSIGEMKRVTGMLVKKITPILHRLQQAYLVFEDQTGGEEYRAWHSFESVFPDVNPSQYERTEAVAEIIKRFLSLNVLAEAEGIKSFYGFSAKDIKTALDKLEKNAAVCSVLVDGRPFWCMREDEALINGVATAGTQEAEASLSGIFLLHRSDFWVKSEEYRLKNRFKAEKADVLYYIVIDGVISGAVLGRFKFGPHLLEDIQTDLDEDEKTARREEILEAVYKVFDRELSPVHKYEGEALP